jgi:prevent-host-death family protein
MEVTTKELRIQPGKILDQVSIGQEVTVTYRGKPLARIVPFSNEEDPEGDSMFGLWKDHESERSVEDLVREARKGRAF